MNQAIVSLIFFAVLVIGAVLFFRKNKGWFWRIGKNRKHEERIWIEDILKLLYHSEKNNQSVSLNSLSGALKMSDAKALSILNKMEVEGFVDATAASIKLEEKGRLYALKIIRVHRLWEKYLSEETGFDKREWHDMAEYMEHHLSHEEAEELALALGNPRFDPHGDPIPKLDGEVRAPKGQVLSKLPVGFQGRIQHVEDEPEVIYRQILDQDLHIGSELEILANSKEHLVFFCEGEKYSLPSLVASNIAVTPLSEGETLDTSIARLSALKDDERGQIVGISKECRGAIRRRLLDLGFVIGASISVENSSPLNNPRAYRIKGTSIALRNKNASQILVKKLSHEKED